MAIHPLTASHWKSGRHCTQFATLSKPSAQDRLRPDVKEEIRRRATSRRNCIGWEEHAPTEELVGTAEISGEH
ncbi:hypothetical protein NITLEN_30220 [Nitrospira lenta]|uniref:Uncharacterized protein n=1 Tax=Nitrospira lenta TaxID=1436998 RepID=A0A330L8J7_9BACT|nr:hypothetical protein NITLEN_30220 [Nitrospira lenta]